MPDVREATESLLASRPELEGPIEEILAVDRSTETWTFDDVPVDSGVFGEIVDAGIVEKTNGAYRIANRSAVERALGAHETEGNALRAIQDRIQVDPGLFVPSVSASTVVALGGALVFLFAMRLLHLRDVFRGDRVLSPANDPYFYRYINDELLAISTDPLSLAVVADLPSRAAGRRPFAHVANWWVAALLGGDQWAAEMTAAWLPVVATVLLGVVLYWTATMVSGDVRIGVATVFVFALSPIHAVYGGLGFLEHRLHQYFWMGVTLLALTYLAVDFGRCRANVRVDRPVLAHFTSPWTWLASVTVAVSLALSILAWGGSIMMTFPLLGYVGFRAALDVRENISPGLVNLPLMAGLTGTVALTTWFHFRWGWHESFVVYVPLLTLVGLVGIFLVGEAFRHANWPVPVYLGVQAATGIVGIYGFRRRFPDIWDRLRSRADDLIYRESAVETTSLFAHEWGGLLSPVMQNGFVFVIALVFLAWGWLVVSRSYHPAMLVPVAYATVWLVLAAIQIRFAAQLWIPLSILGGFGLVAVLSWLDLARSSPLVRDRTESAGSQSPERVSTTRIHLPRDAGQVAWIVVVLVFLGGLSVLFMASTVAETTYDDDQYAALLAMEEHYDTVADADHEDFVLSNWGHNRMYNYFMHGDADSYGYARSHYFDFVTDDTADDWFDQFDDRVGYVVVNDVEQVPASDIVQAKLHHQLDPDGGDLPPTAHYRAVYVGDTATAYAVVPGATITYNSTDAPVESVTTEVTIDDIAFTYEQPFEAVDDESTAATVAYPGEYDIAGESIEVGEADVVNGTEIVLGDGQ